MDEFNTWACGYAIWWPVGFFVGILWMQSRAAQAAKGENGITQEKQG